MEWGCYLRQSWVASLLIDHSYGNMKENELKVKYKVYFQDKIGKRKHSNKIHVY